MRLYLFNGGEGSKVRFQIVKQASQPGAHLDLWGEVEAAYVPRALDERMAIADRFSQKLEAQIDIRPWSEPEALYGADTVAPFDGTIIRPGISTSGLIIDGVIYATACRTRYGPYPYCREMRHGVHSMTKSLGAFLTLLGLAEKYGDHVFDLKLVDYVDIAADHDGWQDVAFDHALNMVTGIDGYEPTRVSYYVDVQDDAYIALRSAQSATDKLQAAAAYGNYPRGLGEVFRYTSPGLFVLSAAMDTLSQVRGRP